MTPKPVVCECPVLLESRFANTLARPASSSLTVQYALVPGSVMTRPTCGAPADSRETDETPSMASVHGTWGGDTTACGSAASNQQPTETSTGLFFLVDGTKQQINGRQARTSGSCCVTRKRCHFSASLPTWHSQLSKTAEKIRLRLATCRLGSFPFPHAGLCWLMLGACARLSRSAQHTAEVPRKRLWRRRESSLGRVSPLRSRTWSVDASRTPAQRTRRPRCCGPMTLVAVRPLSPIHLSLAHVLSSPSFSPYTNRKPITLPPPRHQCFPSALAPLAEPIAIATWTTDQRLSGNMPRGARSARADAETQDAASPQEYP